MRQFFSFVRKEFLHVFRDRKTLLLLFGLPVAQILLFGFALTNEIKNTKIVVCDYAHDKTSRALIQKLEASAQFDLEEALMSHEQIEEAFKKGRVKLAVVFPVNFDKELTHSGKASLQVIADASDPNTASTLTNYVTNITRTYIQETGGVSDPYPVQIDPQIRMIYNPELKGTTNFVPGVMALVLLLVCVLMTSVSIVREKESGTMEVLLVSPFHPLMVILSKAIPYLVVSIDNLAVILLLSVYLLEMPVKGSLFLIVGESVLLIITALSLGLMISNIAASQQAAMLMSLMGMMLPTMLFTGFMFPLENMPLPLRIISNIVPSKWYYIIIKSVMIKGLGFSAIWKETLILFTMAVALLSISLARFKTRLA